MTTEIPRNADCILGFEGSFGDALERLKDGYRVARKGWNGKDMWLALQVPDKHSKMTRPYIYMYTADGQKVPWLASQSDMLENDWQWLTVIPGQ